MRGTPWIPIGPGREVGLSPGPLREHPGTRSPKRVATSAGAGQGLHSNGLRFPISLAPLAPGLVKGGGRSRSAGRRGQITVPSGQGYGGPRAAPRDPAGARMERSGTSPSNPSLLWPCPSQRWAPRPSGPRLSGRRWVCSKGSPRPSVPGPPCAPQVLWAVGGGVDRAVLDAQRDGRLQVALSDPEQGSFACAWREFVSACLCPVCVCAEAPATPRVCTFSVHPENHLETCPSGLA